MSLYKVLSLFTGLKNIDTFFINVLFVILTGMLIYSPKVLEKKPIVMGFDLATVVILVVNGLLFVFTVFTKPLASLIFIIIIVLFLLYKKKFRNQAELMTFFRFKTSPQCVIMDKNIFQLLKND